MKKVAATAALTATLLGGGAVGAAMFAPTLAVAQDADVTPADPDDTSETSTHGARVAEVLAPLVSDGTITQDQADAVVDALVEAAVDQRGAVKDRLQERFGIGGGLRLEALAEATGIDTAIWTEGLRDGLSLADIAEANGSSADAVVDHLVGEASDRLAEAVADGRLDEDKAQERLEDITERITDAVDDDEFRFGRRGRGHHRGFAGRFGPDADSVPMATEGPDA